MELKNDKLSIPPSLNKRRIRTKFPANDSLLTMQVTMSYLEIYNENIRDLLDPSSGYLELRDESGGRNIQVTGCIKIKGVSEFSR